MKPFTQPLKCPHCNEWIVTPDQAKEKNHKIFKRSIFLAIIMTLIIIGPCVILGLMNQPKVMAIIPIDQPLCGRLGYEYKKAIVKFYANEIISENSYYSDRYSFIFDENDLDEILNFRNFINDSILKTIYIKYYEFWYYDTLYYDVIDYWEE